MPQFGTVEMLDIAGGTIFLAPITVGGQEFNVVIDTGSSDPWLVITEFSCFDPASDIQIPEADCFFGPLYDKLSSPTYSKLVDRSMNLSYASGETLNGLMGRETFTMADITVPSQEFGLVDYAAWNGDGVSSGLVGFAYRTLTSMYIGEVPKDAVPGRALKYNTLFDNMYRSNTTDPVFSMALTRDPNYTGKGGLMSLGGIPNIPFGPTWISTPIIPVSINRTSGEIEYQFYTISIDGFSISADPGAQFSSAADARRNPRKTPLKGPVDPSDPDSTRVNAIVDSGTSLVYIEDELALEVAEAFRPPGWKDEATNLYTVPCGSTPPTFGVSVEGKVFNVHPDDMILQAGPDLCISGVQENHDGLWILGDVWMKAVLCVFDVGSGWMRFAGRQYYGLSWD